MIKYIIILIVLISCDSVTNEISNKNIVFKIEDQLNRVDGFEVDKKIENRHLHMVRVLDSLGYKLNDYLHFYERFDSQNNTFIFCFYDQENCIRYSRSSDYGEKVEKINSEISMSDFNRVIFGSDYYYVSADFSLKNSSVRILSYDIVTEKKSTLSPARIDY